MFFAGLGVGDEPKDEDGSEDFCSFFLGAGGTHFGERNEGRVKEEGEEKEKVNGKSQRERK